MRTSRTTKLVQDELSVFQWQALDPIIKSRLQSNWYLQPVTKLEVKDWIPKLVKKVDPEKVCEWDMIMTEIGMFDKTY